jgi:hypothetical protein
MIKTARWKRCVPRLRRTLLGIHPVRSPHKTLMMHTSSGLQRQHSIRHTTPLIIKKRKENPMTTTQTELVQASFAKVLPIADEAAALFYGRLFELDPALRPLAAACASVGRTGPAS